MSKEDELSEQLEEESLEKIKENAKSVLKNNSKHYAFIDLGGNVKKLLAEGDNIKKVEKEMIKEFMNICCNDIMVFTKPKMKRFHKKQFFIYFIRLCRISN